MDTIALVDEKIDDGQRLVDQLSEDGIPFRAAFWAKLSDEDRWLFYLVTSLVDEKGTTEAYLQILPVLRSLGDFWITSFDFNLIGEKNQLAADVIKLMKRYPDRRTIHSPDVVIDFRSVEEIYIYPLDKVKVTVYGLVFRGDPSVSLHLSLEPHNPGSKFILESEAGNRQEYPGETGIDWTVAAPAGSTLERNEIGLMVLAWNQHGQRIQSNANEVWALAKCGVQGFRLLKRAK